MVVQHNLTAMNSNRMLGLTTATQAKSTEKLSSGYKINRAADDAAGLAISEKMRKQIRGLTQASANAQDGISAVQTAEGALTEVHDMLQRMNELAVKAANGTMSEDDRSYVQNEIDQLVTEIDRVSETTKFNETYLLKGNGTAPVAKEISFKDLGADKDITAKITDSNGKKITTTAETDITTGRTELNLGDLKNIVNGDSITVDGIKYVFDDTGAATAPNTTTIMVDTSTATTTDDIAAAFQTAIQTQSNTQYAANPDTGNIESSAVLKDKDGNYILTMQSRTDANRVKPTAAGTYKTDGGIVIGTAANQVISDGQEVTVGKVKLVGEMTKADGTTQAALGSGANQGKINLDKYEGGELSLVYNADDAIWTATTPAGESSTYTTAELKDIGIGVTKGDDATTFAALDAATYGFSGASAIADGFTLKISKQAVGDTSDPLVSSVNLNGLDLSQYELGDDIKVSAGVSAGDVISFSNVAPQEEKITPLTLSLHVGADSTVENKISLDIEAMSAKGLGIDGLKVDGPDSTNADNAIDTIEAAIKKVSTQRSSLGAIQNRLEHTINNLDNVVENTTSAESAIRDTDMATEMVRFANNNILAQAGQSMLAQANQSNQGVLSLLG